MERAGDDSRGGVAFLAAATSVADSLGCQVIAEGVERPAEASVVRILNLPYAQGNYYQTPVPLARMVAMLGSQPASTETPR